MNNSTKQLSITYFGLISLILLCSFFINNVFSEKYWKPEFTTVKHNPVENSITIRFKFYNYRKELREDKSFLEKCDFFYSIDGKNYIMLMRAECYPQNSITYIELNMCFRNPDTNLQLLGCIRPKSGTMWRDNSNSLNIRVRNEYEGQLIINRDFKKEGVKKYEAFFSVKWLLGDKYKDVKFIQLEGIWKENKWYSERIQFIYDLSYQHMLNSTVGQSEKNRVKVVANADAIVITGAGKGEIIKVCNAFGEFQSIVTNRDIIQIQLPKNQIYFVNIGNARYKVAL